MKTIGCFLALFAVGCGAGAIKDPEALERDEPTPALDAGFVAESGFANNDGGLQLDVSDDVGAQPLGDAACAATSAKASKTPVDIILAIDQSLSMDDDIARVRDNINKLTSHLAATKLDYRVVVIAQVGTVPAAVVVNVVCVPPPLGGDMSLCESASPLKNSNPPVFRTSNQYVGSKTSLTTIVSSYATYAGLRWDDFVRADAFKAIIPVTDDNSYMTAADFDSQLIAKDPVMFGTATARKYAAYPIMGAAAYPSEEKCGSTMVNNGANYIALAKLTNGRWWPLCSTNWASLFTEIAGSIAERVACEFVIPPAPSGKTLDPSKVNVTFTPSSGTSEPILRDDSAACASGANGWQYNADKTKIVLCGGACTRAQSDTGARVDVSFGCATVFKPPS